MPAECEAWLVDLASAEARAEGDLCARHATLLALPRGWQLRDHRNTPAEDLLPSRRAALRSRRRGLVAAPVANGGAGAPVGRRDSEMNEDRIEEQNVAGEPLSEVLHANTPLLRRAFQNLWPLSDY